MNDRQIRISEFSHECEESFEQEDFFVEWSTHSNTGRSPDYIGWYLKPAFEGQADIPIKCCPYCGVNLYQLSDAVFDALDLGLTKKEGK